MYILWPLIPLDDLTPLELYRLIALFVDNARVDKEYCRVCIRSLVTCANAEIATVTRVCRNTIDTVGAPALTRRTSSAPSGRSSGPSAAST